MIFLEDLNFLLQEYLSLSESLSDSFPSDVEEEDVDDASKLDTDAVEEDNNRGEDVEEEDVDGASEALDTDAVWTAAGSTQLSLVRVSRVS